MKTLKLVPMFLIAFLFSNYTAVAQEEEEAEDEPQKIIGVFIGFSEGTYNFSYKEDGENLEIGFEKVTPEVLKILNSDTKEQIGKSFEVMYSSMNEEEKDNDGDIMYINVKTIVSLKPLE